MNNFATDMCDYCCSGHALLNIDTFEKDRAITEIISIANDIDRTVYIWSISQGWTNTNGSQVCDVKPLAPIEDHLKAILDFDDGVICILKDFGGYLRHETYSGYDIVIGWLDELRKIVSSVQQTIVFVGPDFSSPKQLLHDITHVDFSLPNEQQIKERIEFACSDIIKTDGTKFKPDTNNIEKAINACRGMTCSQIVDRITLAIRKHKDLNEGAIQTIIREKAGIIRSSGILGYVEPPDGGLGNVGGYDAIKQHIKLDKPCFTKEAMEFGIEFPRGLMLVGIPGCGKTLLSLAIASELELPLISMDIGNLMDKYVGESESNMREAIKMLESIAPAVLVLDEIEKGFGGVGDADGGSSRRVFGIFIKWLNDRQSPVYVVATANQVQSLPPEFCRKGRFDEIYGLDTPQTHEREEIFYIHLYKRNKNPKDFDISRLASITADYTGADIEQVIKLSLKKAFVETEELNNLHIEQSIAEIAPLSKTEADRVSNIREWCAIHTKPANPKEENNTPKHDTRKVTIN